MVLKLYVMQHRERICFQVGKSSAIIKRLAHGRRCQVTASNPQLSCRWAKWTSSLAQKPAYYS